MILKYKSTTPDYAYLSSDEIEYYEEIHELLKDFYAHIYANPKEYNLPFNESQDVPLITLEEHFVTLVRHTVESWNYIDNVKMINTKYKFEPHFGYGLHVYVTLNSEDDMELSFTESAFLINDNGKTIEQLKKGKLIDHSNREKTLKVFDRYFNKEINRGELFEELYRIISGECDDVNDDSNNN